MVRFRSGTDYDLVPLEKGDRWIDLALNEFPLFVKKNRAVLLCPGGESSEFLDDARFTVIGQIEQDSVYEPMMLYSGKGKPVKDLQTEMDTETIMRQGDDVT